MSHNVKILPGATVCEDCTLEGDITIGGGTVIHPRVTIIAEGGPIIIAEYCIIEEYSTIIHKLRSGHIPLNSFKFLMKKADIPNCADCRVREDVYHLLTECVRRAPMREEVYRTLKVNQLDVGLFQSVLASPTSSAAHMLYRSIYRKSDKQETPPKPLFIGAHNVFEVGCKLESPCGHIGESNVFECRSFVGVDVKIGSGCVIGAACHLTAPQTLVDNTVIWGSEHHIREALEKQPSQLLQLDFLSKVMPNYHRLRKPNVHKRQPSRQSQESSPKL